MQGYGYVVFMLFNIHTWRRLLGTKTYNWGIIFSYMLTFVKPISFFYATSKIYAYTPDINMDTDHVIIFTI